MPFVSPDPDIPRGIAVRDVTLDSTSDWMRTLVDVLTYVAMIDALDVSTFFVAESHPTHVDADVLLLPVAPAVDLRHIAVPADASALVVLHPPGAQRMPDLEEPDGLPLASGSLVLPGVPEIGLDHRAAWAAVNIRGQVARMNFTTHAQLTENLDLTVLGALLSRHLDGPR